MKISNFLGKRIDDALNFYGKEVMLSDDEAVFLDTIYLEIPQRGICLVADRESGEIYCIQLFGSGKDDIYEAFIGQVDGDLFLSDSRETVRGKLGVPYESNPGEIDVINPWDAFVYSNFRIHCEYAPDGSRILLISLQDVRSVVGVSASEILMVIPEPSLLSVLEGMEREKGSPLTIEEVLEARDNCQATVMPRYFKLYKENERGYVDIDVDNPWDSWRLSRFEGPEPGQGGGWSPRVKSSCKSTSDCNSDGEMRIEDFLGKSLEIARLHYKDQEGRELFVVDNTSESDTYFDIPSLGIAFVSNHLDRIVCVQLYTSEKDESYANYSGDLFEGLKFSDSRVMARQKLKNVIRSREGGSVVGSLINRYLGPWDAYAVRHRDLLIGCEFSDDASHIQFVTVRQLHLWEDNP